MFRTLESLCHLHDLVALAVTSVRKKQQLALNISIWEALKLCVYRCTGGQSKSRWTIGELQVIWAGLECGLPNQKLVAVTLQS
jgi:hypothetical protein